MNENWQTQQKSKVSTPNPSYFTAFNPLIISSLSLLIGATTSVTNKPQFDPSVENIDWIDQDGF